jgi:hypothetical protein
VEAWVKSEREMRERLKKEKEVRERREKAMVCFRFFSFFFGSILMACFVARKEEERGIGKR